MDEKLERKRFNKLKLAEKNRRLRIEQYISATMQHPQGRDFIYWILEISRVGRNPFTANALTTSFNCGELNIGQQIQDLIIQTTPDDYLKMLMEKETERLNDLRDAELDNRSDADTEPSGPEPEPASG